jgi:integrase
VWSLTSCTKDTKMGRRGNGEGSIRRRKDGRWEGRYTVHTAEGRQQKTVYGKTRKEVAEKLTEAMASRDQGVIFDAGKLTVGDHLEQYLHDVVKPSASHRTYSTHAQQIRSHIAPTLGRIKLKNLRKAHIDRLYREKLEAGLAPSTVRRVHAVLHKALEEAVKGDLIPRNPATHANKPKVKQDEIEPLDASEAAAFLKAAKGDRFEALYILCIMCGLRQGEALALRWRDIDLDGGTLRVNLQLQRVRGGGGLRFSEPKNASRRTVGLPQRAVSALKSHRKHQLEEKLAAGPLYQDEGARVRLQTWDAHRRSERSQPLLQTTTQTGEPPPIRFHDLRHSCLSLLAQRGEPIRDLQALAGHATAAFTLQRYTHHYDASARRTAEAIDDILPDES